VQVSETTTNPDTEQETAVTLETEDGREGLRSFVDRREARFTGR
jgi:hypothetical protein